MYGKQNQLRLNADAFKKRVEKTVEQEIGEVYEELDQIVAREINSSITNVVAATLGISRRWGEWEITRTNGIDGETPAGIALRQAASEKAREIVLEALKDFTPPKGLLQSIRKEYTERLGYEAEQIAGRIAAQHAEEWGVAFVEAELAKLDLPEEGAPANEAEQLLREVAEGKLTTAKAIKERAKAVLS